MVDFDLDRDLKPKVHAECLSGETDICRRSLITRLMEISLMYDMLDEHCQNLADAILDYVNHAVEDGYEAAKK